MRKRSILSVLKESGSRVVTTRDVSLLTGKSLSTTTQSLGNLARDGVVVKICRGVWAQSIGSEAISPYEVAMRLFPLHRAYVSFISALHIHGIIEQIPQVTTLASTAHAGTIRTAVGVFHVHHIAPSFFAGFGWYKGNGSFLVAEPEKAFVDCIYLSAYKKKRFGHFPELHFSNTFSFKKVKAWVSAIPSRKTRIYAGTRIEKIRSEIA